MLSAFSNVHCVVRKYHTFNVRLMRNAPNRLVLAILQEELDGFASKFPSRFTVYYVLTQVGY